MNSRWSTSPHKNNGQIVSIRPHAHIPILKAIADHGILPVPYIAALLGRTYKPISRATNKLKRKPAELIEVCSTQSANPRQYQYTLQAFNLTPKGEAFLQDEGYAFRQVKSSIHQITNSQTTASFQIGARDRLITWDDILADAHTPQGALPYIPVDFDFKGHHYDKAIRPDSPPFGIRYGDNCRFFVLETDLGSEPIKTMNRDRQAIENKFAGYLTALEQNLCEKVWGFQNVFVLFTTTTRARLNSMMSVLDEMTDDRRLKRRFAFQQFPSILSATPQPRDYGWAFTQPWKIIGGELNIGES